MTHVLADGAPASLDSAWRPRQLRGLTITVLVAALLVRAFVLYRGQLEDGGLASLGAIAAGASPGGDASVLEWALGRFSIALAPMEYWPLGTFLLLLWGAYCAASWLAVRALATSPATRLALLALLLFSPMTLPGLSAWPIGVTSASLAVGVLLATYGAATYARSSRARGLVALVGATLIAVLGADAGLVSPAIVVPAWAIALLWIPGLVTQSPGRGTTPLSRLVWSGGAALTPLVVYVGWTALGVGVPGVTIPRDLGRVAGFVGESLGAGVLPALAGGPVFWSAGPTTWPAASAPFVVSLLGTQVLLAGVIATTLLTGRGLRPWALALGFTAALLTLLPLALPDRTIGTGPQMLGLAAVPAVLLVAAWAAGERAPTGLPLTSGQRALISVMAIDAFIALSLVSTLAWSDAREPYRGNAYVASSLISLAEAPRDVPLLPQVVPTDVVDFAYAPLNRTDIVFAPAANRPEFGTWTTRLAGLDPQGALRPAVIDGISIPVACDAWAPQVPIGQSLPAFDYVLAIGKADGDLSGFTVRLGDGPATVIPAGIEATTVYAMVSGSGSTITIASLGDQTVCPTALRIGQVRVLSPELEGGAA
jgi:hypothetical protein